MKKKHKISMVPDVILTRKEIKALRRLTKEHKEANMFVITQEHTSGIGINTFVRVSSDPNSDLVIHDITDYESW